MENGVGGRTRSDELRRWRYGGMENGGGEGMEDGELSRSNKGERMEEVKEQKGGKWKEEEKRWLRKNGGARE